MILLICSCAPPEQKQKNVCTFCVDDELVVLNGNVKHISIEYESITNPGQDYDIVDLDKKEDITKASHGFHGMALSMFYVTNYNKFGEKSETINYLIIHKHRRIKDIFNSKVKGIDSIKKVSEIYVYNNEGNITRVGYMLDGPITENLYKYNLLGDLVESDSPPMITYYKYDNYHNLLESNNYVNGHFQGKNTYKYILFDTHNNWTKAINVS